MQESDVRHVAYDLQGRQTADVVNSVTLLDVRSRRTLFLGVGGILHVFPYDSVGEHSDH